MDIRVGYQLFEGNTAETKTLIPILEVFQKRFGLHKPVVVADSALLSQKNIDALCEGGYTYILGGRLKNEPDPVKQQVLQLGVEQAKPGELAHRNGRVIVTYSGKAPQFEVLKMWVMRCTKQQHQIRNPDIVHALFRVFYLEGLSFSAARLAWRITLRAVGA